MVNLNGRNYFVDQELREFRSAGDRFATADFVRFDSAQGHALWDQYLIATCSKCGTERVDRGRHPALNATAAVGGY